MRQEDGVTGEEAEPAPPARRPEVLPSAAEQPKAEWEIALEAQESVASSEAEAAADAGDAITSGPEAARTGAGAATSEPETVKQPVSEEAGTDPDVPEETAEQAASEDAGTASDVPEDSAKEAEEGKA